MIIFGRRTIRIKKYDDFNIKCENCGKYHQRFYTYQQYFHIMFIPFFPIGIKSVRCSCVECNDAFNQQKKNDYLSMTKTPIYMFSGGLLVIGIIVLATLGNIKNQNQTREFAYNPMIGDVYRIRYNENSNTSYYFLKIKDINSDTINILHSALQYTGYISTMNDSDFFVKNDEWRFLKSDLINYLDSGYISSIVRNYSESSRFNIEK